MKKILILTIIMVTTFAFNLNAKPCRVIDVFKDYKNIHIGWVDLGENKFQQYRYTSKGEWITEIVSQNQQFQYAVKGLMKDWPTTLAGKAGEAAPKDEGTIIIKFNNIVYNEQGILFCMLEFIDAATGKVIKKQDAKAEAKGMSFGFSAILTQAMSSLAKEVKNAMTKN